MPKHLERETDIQTAIIEFMRRSGWFAFKVHQGSKYCYPGVADIYGLKRGIQVWVEVKSAKGVQEDDQIKFEADVKEHGGIYLIVRSLEESVHKLLAISRGAKV